VLFLDELSEFSRHTIEALRQPMEDGRVAIVRANRAAVYPARFMLVAATNPCPCGYAGAVERCSCSDADLARHRRKLSGPLLDRVDLLVHLEREPASHAPRGAVSQPENDHYDAHIASAQARDAVLAARERQLSRYAGDGILVNAHLDARLMRRHLGLGERAEAMLRAAQERGLLSARGTDRTARVARTVADLAGSELVRGEDMGGALAFRPATSLVATRAA
jgi:magnesium chelatase family protein